MVAVEKRILVVDDEEIVRESCKRVLTDAGYTVRTAANGRDALRVCRDEPFDAMLTDLRMPDMDGIEVIRAVTKEFPEVRVVVITGYPSRESAEQARRLGIFDYLEKPLSPMRLSAAAAAVLASPPHSSPISLPAAAPESDIPAAAQIRTEEKSVVDSGTTSKSKAARPMVITSLGFLLGVSVAYFLAPSQALAYLAVITAIASGTLLGVYSDALFARSAEQLK